MLTAGQKGDAPQAAACWKAYLYRGRHGRHVRRRHLRQAIAAKGALAVIPTNPSRALKYRLDKHLYAQRHLVECCFRQTQKHSGRDVATRFGQISAQSFETPLSRLLILWMR